MQYILQKDTPMMKAGVTYEKDAYDNYSPVLEGEGGYWSVGAVFPKDIVENNPEWFLPRKTNEVTNIHSNLAVCVIEFKYTIDIRKYYDKIKEAIDKVINE